MEIKETNNDNGTSGKHFEKLRPKETNRDIPCGRGFLWSRGRGFRFHPDLAAVGTLLP